MAISLSCSSKLSLTFSAALHSTSRSLFQSYGCGGFGSSGSSERSRVNSDPDKL